MFFAYLADILMLLASLGAAVYCMILSRRLARLTSFDQGIGGAIAVLSAQVDEMKSALADAKAGSDGAGRQLSELVGQARDISGELELMIAACHDFAEEAIEVQNGGAAGPRSDRLAPGIAEIDTAADIVAAGPKTLSSAANGAAAAEMPVFGSRRRRADTPPVFRHNGSMGAAE